MFTRKNKHATEWEETHAKHTSNRGSEQRTPRTNRKTDITNEKQVEDLNRVFTKETIQMAHEKGLTSLTTWEL